MNENVDLLVRIAHGFADDEEAFTALQELVSELDRLRVATMIASGRVDWCIDFVELMGNNPDWDRLLQGLADVRSALEAATR